MFVFVFDDWVGYVFNKVGVVCLFLGILEGKVQYVIG